jgi:hypothetical protein
MKGVRKTVLTKPGLGIAGGRIKALKSNFHSHLQLKGPLDETVGTGPRTGKKNGENRGTDLGAIVCGKNCQFGSFLFARRLIKVIDRRTR